MDIKHSLLADAIYASDTDFTHRNSDGSIAGLNAAFPDGHVTWQGTNRVPEAFNPNVRVDLQANANGDELRYIMSLFQP